MIRQCYVVCNNICQENVSLCAELYVNAVLYDRAMLLLL